MSLLSNQSRCAPHLFPQAVGRKRLPLRLVSSFFVLMAVACEPAEDNDGQESGDSSMNSQASDESSASSKNSKNSQNSSDESNSSDSSTNDDDDDDDDDSNTPDSDSEDSPDDDGDTPDTATPSEDSDSEDSDSDSEDSDSDSDSEDSDSEDSDSDSEDSESEETGDETGNPDDEIDWEKEVAHVFPQDRIVKLSIKFPSGDLQTIVDDWNTKKVKTRLGAAFDFEGKEQLESVGVRLKGYSSLLFGTGTGPGPGGSKLKTTHKLPLKINFDSEGGPRFHHFDKLSLSNLVFDPSAMRNRLTVRMFRALGVPAPAVSHAELNLDDNVVGVYSMIENVDKRFLKRFFGTKNDADDGNLYKCVAHQPTGPDRSDQICLLKWKGDTKADYYKTSGCETGYEECGLVLKTNEDDPALNNYEDLINLLDVLHNTPSDEFEMEFQEVFDVDSFLRLMAVNVVLANFDSYFGRINNYYLYHRPDTGKFMMIPWDLNMSYGGYGCHGTSGGSDLTQFSIDDPVCRSPSTSQSYPLVDKILEVSSFRTQYEAYVDEFVNEHFTVSKHEELIKQFDQQISASLETDPNFGYSMDQYKTAISDQMSNQSQMPGGFGNYNLLDFVKRRIEAVSR